MVYTETKLHVNLIHDGYSDVPLELSLIRKIDKMGGCFYFDEKSKEFDELRNLGFNSVQTAFLLLVINSFIEDKMLIEIPPLIEIGDTCLFEKGKEIEGVRGALCEVEKIIVEKTIEGFGYTQSVDETGKSPLLVFNLVSIEKFDDKEPYHYFWDLKQFKGVKGWKE